jgi:hypothetical protein
MEFILKHPDEVGGIIESELLGDLIDRQLGELQRTQGGVQPVAGDEIADGHTCDHLETFKQCGPVHIDQSA